MQTAVDSSVGVVAYLALFGGVGFVFVFVNLLLGRFLRPSNPTEEKREIYECGEPAIGSSFVQFDLRFYVVALVFIIFDVEVAFLFPWATVYGKVTHAVSMLDPDYGQQFPATATGLFWEPEKSEVTEPTPGQLVVSGKDGLAWAPNVVNIYREMGIRDPQLPQADSATAANRMLMSGERNAEGQFVFAGFGQIMAVAAIAVSFFFVVLLVGFAYEWRTGALDWVRAVSGTPPPAIERRASRSATPQESVLSV
ncbi:MAG: NAD(P)H-quinone oxidoreductase subunit 3 [Planctomycetaceae bacterium]|nr:NAD(P)H-quinone oxidoreductase subunit 3 [Planctomycetaceae bacterium]